MFEKHTLFDSAQQQADSAFAEDGLRAFDWHELGARVAAAHELRLVLRDSRAIGSSSFGHVQAGRLGLSMGGAARESVEGKRTVNPVDLGHCKSSSRNEAQGDDAAMKASQRAT